MATFAWTLTSLVLAARAALAFTHFTDLVAFGDSYTDEGRLSYFQNNNGNPPPKGYVPPVNNDTTDGYYIWARMVAQQTGVTLHDYAVSGAVCSNELTARSCTCIPGTEDFPSVQDYEIPAFFQDYQVTSRGHTSLKLNPATTMYSIWIGTNDLGNAALLTDEHAPGVTLTNVTDCVVNSVERLYNAGARYFLFQNVAPLWLAPQYATPERDGVSGPNHYFPNKDQYLGGNLTAINDKMKQLVVSTNQIWKYQLPATAATLKDAKIALFDSHSLFLDIINNPREFLTAPYNTTGYISHCNVADNCATTYINDPNHLDGYVWYDELHPSRRTDQIVAEEFVKAMNKQSKYAYYYY